MKKIILSKVMYHFCLCLYCQASFNVPIAVSHIGVYVKHFINGNIWQNRAHFDDYGTNYSKRVHFLKIFLDMTRVRHSPTSPAIPFPWNYPLTEKNIHVIPHLSYSKRIDFHIYLCNEGSAFAEQHCGRVRSSRRHLNKGFFQIGIVLNLDFGSFYTFYILKGILRLSGLGRGDGVSKVLYQFIALRCWSRLV